MSNDSLNGFMVTHDVHFILLALGLKKKCGAGVGRTHLEENKKIIGHLRQWVMEWIERGSGGLHAEILSPLPISLSMSQKLFGTVPHCMLLISPTSLWPFKQGSEDKPANISSPSKRQDGRIGCPWVWVLFCLFGVAPMGDDTAKATNP